jgi:hypothetical protein
MVLWLKFNDKVYCCGLIFMFEIQEKCKIYDWILGLKYMATVWG